MRSRVLILLLFVLLSAWPASGADTWSGADRIVALGDVHGDYNAFLGILRAAGVVDGKGKWAGGKTRFVQTGDMLDRGPYSRKCLDLLMALEKQAAAAGGAVHALIGNHEAMNIYGDLRYVTPADYASFRTDTSEQVRDLYYEQFKKDLQKTPPPEGLPEFNSEHRRKWNVEHPLGFVEQRIAFGPEGVYGKWIRSHNAVVKINDMVFLHGGISPKYQNTNISEFNTQITAELTDFSKLEKGMAMDQEGPLWYRGLAEEDEARLEPHVDAVLQHLGAKYIVIGHTPTRGMITPRVNGKVIVIDVGLSAFYGSHPACLIVEGGKQFALHRGRRVPLPGQAPDDRMRYTNQIGVIEQTVR